MVAKIDELADAKYRWDLTVSKDALIAIACDIIFVYENGVLTGYDAGTGTALSHTELPKMQSMQSYHNKQSQHYLLLQDSYNKWYVLHVAPEK